ncbi:MAG: hypothetical protein HUJ96_10565 [Marinilabiliaceae bacterium]|nr:hypothetical protein [Marinilabiliaceae bacterium]
MKKQNIIILVASAIIITLTILYFTSRSEMAEMEEVFTEEKENLLTEYQDLYSDFDSLRSNNAELEQKLEMERERVAQLQEELRTTKVSNARRIKELQGELTTMRTVMRSFVVQIDSLNQTNAALRKENEGMKNQVAQARRTEAQLKEENAILSDQVSIAARLSTRNIAGYGLTNKDKKSSRIDNISKIKISFTIDKNITAQTGMRPIYIRIERPDGELLMHSKNDTFQFEDQQINYSARRDVEYGGEDTETYIIYNVDSGELMKGVYNVEIFSSGELIGSGSFTLS